MASARCGAAARCDGPPGNLPLERGANAHYDGSRATNGFNGRAPSVASPACAILVRAKDAKLTPGGRGTMADVLFERRDPGIGLITLNRPESLNAMGGDMIP